MHRRGSRGGVEPAYTPPMAEGKKKKKKKKKSDICYKMIINCTFVLLILIGRYILISGDSFVTYNR